MCSSLHPDWSGYCASIPTVDLPAGSFSTIDSFQAPHGPTWIVKLRAPPPLDWSCLCHPPAVFTTEHRGFHPESSGFEHRLLQPGMVSPMTPVPQGAPTSFVCPVALPSCPASRWARPATLPTVPATTSWPCSWPCSPGSRTWWHGVEPSCVPCPCIACAWRMSYPRFLGVAVVHLALASPKARRCSASHAAAPPWAVFHPEQGQQTEGSDEPNQRPWQTKSKVRNAPNPGRRYPGLNFSATSCRYSGHPEPISSRLSVDLPALFFPPYKILLSSSPFFFFASSILGQLEVV